MIEQKKHVFLSYCHDNQLEVERLRKELVEAGEDVWWDQDIHPGQDWRFEIRKAMQNAYAVVLCLSKESAVRASSGIYPEALDAITFYREYSPGTIFLIPVRLSPCAIPSVEIDGTRTLDRLQYQDLFPSENYVANVQKLLGAIRKTPCHPLSGSQEMAATAPASHLLSAHTYDQTRGDVHRPTPYPVRGSTGRSNPRSTAAKSASIPRTSMLIAGAVIIFAAFAIYLNVHWQKPKVLTLQPSGPIVQVPPTILFRGSNKKASGQISNDLVAELQHALSLHPRDPKLLNDVGAVLASTDQMTEGNRLLGEALKYAPSDPIINYNYGRSLYAEGKTPEAIQAVDNALQLQPDFDEAHLLKAAAAVKQADYQTAEQQISQLLKKGVRIALIIEGVIQLSKREFQQALNSFAEALKLDPQDDAALYNSGVASQGMNNLSDAESFYRRAIASNPTFAEAHNNLGTILVHSGNDRAALAEFQQAASLRPDNETFKEHASKVAQLLGSGKQSPDNGSSAKTSPAISSPHSDSPTSAPNELAGRWVLETGGMVCKTPCPPHPTFQDDVWKPDLIRKSIELRPISDDEYRVIHFEDTDLSSYWTIAKRVSPHVYEAEYSEPFAAGWWNGSCVSKYKVRFEVGDREIKETMTVDQTRKGVFKIKGSGTLNCNAPEYSDADFFAPIVRYLPRQSH